MTFETWEGVLLLALVAASLLVFIKDLRRKIGSILLGLAVMFIP